MILVDFDMPKNCRKCPIEGCIYHSVNDTRPDLCPIVREVKRGKWIYLKERKYKRGGRNSDHKEVFGTEWRTELSQECSCCGMTTMLDASIAYQYCPHCGADLRENTNET